MRDPRMMRYYHAETAHCDFCDITFFRTLVIAFTVLSTIVGAVIVGFSLVIKGGARVDEGPIYDEFGVQLDHLSTAMVVVGAIVMIMSIVGCLAAIFENSWFTVLFVMTLILCMASQISCGILTLFLRKEVEVWALEQKDCETCFEDYEEALRFPTINAIIMLAALGIQLAVIATECKSSHMRKSAKRAMLLSEFIPHDHIVRREAEKSQIVCVPAGRKAARYESLKEDECGVAEELPAKEISGIQHQPLGDSEDPKPKSKPSTSPAKIISPQPSEPPANTREPITEGEVLVH